MNSQTSIKNQVKKLKEHILPKPPKDILIRFWYPFDENDPHGTYGGCVYNITAKEQKTIPEEQELKELREYYDQQIPHHCKENPDHVWSTFEKFLEYYRCECGFFGHEKRLWAYSMK